MEDEVRTLPCQNDLKNFVTHDILDKKLKPLASKNDLEVEVGMVTDVMAKKRDLENLAKLEDLEKLSEEVTSLSKKVTNLSEKVSILTDEVGKCAKQEELDNLAVEVNRLS